jgi:chromosome segregation protein
MSLCGAEFRKSDFQVHSPRDAGWDGPRPEDGLVNPSADQLMATREAYCKNFIKKCVSEGLRAVAITSQRCTVNGYLAT